MWFGAVNSLAADLLLGTSIINQYIRENIHSGAEARALELATSRHNSRSHKDREHRDRCGSHWQQTLYRICSHWHIPYNSRCDESHAEATGAYTKFDENYQLKTVSYQICRRQRKIIDSASGKRTSGCDYEQKVWNSTDEHVGWASLDFKADDRSTCNQYSCSHHWNWSCSTENRSRNDRCRALQIVCS